jgi:hypothetical protein
MDDAKRQLQVLRAKAGQEDEQRKADEWGVRSDDILGILTVMTESFSQASTEHTRECVAVGERLSGMSSDVQHIKDDVASLCKVVRDGNGQPSMLQRLAKLEMVVKATGDELEEVKSHANTIIAAKALSKSQVVAGLIGMIVTALLSTLALVATL